MNGRQRPNRSGIPADTTRSDGGRVEVWDGLHNRFLTEIANNHLPHIYDALKQIAAKLGVHPKSKSRSDIALGCEEGFKNVLKALGIACMQLSTCASLQTTKRSPRCK